MVNHLKKLLELYPNRNWSWRTLSLNPNITWENVQEDLKNCMESKEQCIQNTQNIKKLDDRLDVTFINFDLLFEKMDELTERLKGKM